MALLVTDIDVVRVCLLARPAPMFRDLIFDFSVPLAGESGK